MPENAAAESFEFAGRSITFSAAHRFDHVVSEMREGRYEPPLPMLLMATLARTRGTFLDVGANTGLYTVLATAADPNQVALAFEPFPYVADILDANIAINGANDRTWVYRVALSDQNGTANLFIPDDSHGLVETSCSLEEAFKPAAKSITVDMRRLDDMGLNTTFSVMKVDIEGHEAAFMRGADATIRRDRPIIFAEMLPPAAHTFGALSRDLAALDYRPFRMRPNMLIETREIAHDPAAWNYALVPVEKLDVIEDACRTHGLDIVATWRRD